MGGRRRGRGGQRLLYWFRTPPGVRVGRAALDDEAIRLIEQHNPDVQFDWARLLKEAAPEPPRREREGRDTRDSRDGRDRDRRERRDTRQPPRPRPMETSAAAAPPLRTPEDAEEMQALAEAAEQRAAEHAEVLAGEHAELSATESTDVRATDTAEAGAAESTEGPVSAAEGADGRDRTDPDSAAAARLGSEGVRRLQSRYLDLKTRLAQKDDLEPDARVELAAALERLNPDAWQTSEEVSAALEQYESTFERVRSVVGRHSRRRV